jgi:hypothetical protein
MTGLSTEADWLKRPAAFRLMTHPGNLDDVLVVRTSAITGLTLPDEVLLSW